MKTISVRFDRVERDTLPGLLEENAVSVNAYAEEFFSHPSFGSETGKGMAPVVIASLAELGFEDGATSQEILERIPFLGLKPCRSAAGLYLRLAWKDQPKSRNSILSGQHHAPDGSVTVFSIPLEQDDSFPKGLYLRNVDGRLWLRGYVCDASYRWSCDDFLAFELPEKL